MLTTPIAAQELQVRNEAITDEAISQAVLRKFRMHEAISAHLIDVSTHDGVVRLSGAVSQLPAKGLAASLAMDIAGVRAIVNELIVHPLPRTDDIIESDIRQALTTDPATDSYAIDVSVGDGVATLSGTVKSDAERRLAAQIVQGVKGIREIKNGLALRDDRQWTDAEIRREIERRFRFVPNIMPEMLDVAVEDGAVTLTGVVGSLAEQTNLESTAWVDGVKSVDGSGIAIEWWTNRATRTRIQGLLPDPRLHEALRDALLYDPRVSAFDLDVAVENRVATLSGIVDNLKARRAAEQDARNTPGMRAVKNHILVRPQTRLPDDELAEAVTGALQRDSIMERYELQVIARNHKIYLSGNVDSYYEKWWAEDIIARVSGVVDIQNSLVVNYEWSWKSDHDVKVDVEHELFWDLAVDSDAITVEAEDGVVLLSGKVDSWQEVEKAVQNAFEGGAKSVQSRLRIRDDANEYPVRFQYRYYR